MEGLTRKESKELTARFTDHKEKRIKEIRERERNNKKLAKHRSYL